MHKKKIWFALVGVKPLKGNDIITNVKGAYVNIACVANDEEDFVSKFKEVFLNYKFKVFEINDIETEENLSIDNKENAEKVSLLKEIKEGYSFAWGSFHTY